MATWEKAGYGGTTQKKGGAKLDGVTTKGDRGMYKISGLGNSSVSRAKGIVTPTTDGNKGVDKKTGGGGGAKAPKD